MSDLPFRFPVWFLLDADQSAIHLYRRPNGAAFLPVFTSADLAESYLASAREHPDFEGGGIIYGATGLRAVRSILLRGLSDIVASTVQAVAFDPVRDVDEPSERGGDFAKYMLLSDLVDLAGLRTQ